MKFFCEIKTNIRISPTGAGTPPARSLRGRKARCCGKAAGGNLPSPYRAAGSSVTWQHQHPPLPPRGAFRAKAPPCSPVGADDPARTTCRPRMWGAYSSPAFTGLQGGAAARRAGSPRRRRSAIVILSVLSCAHLCGKLHLHGAGVVAGRIVQQVFPLRGCQQRGVPASRRLPLSASGAIFQRQPCSGRAQLELSQEHRAVQPVAAAVAAWVGRQALRWRARIAACWSGSDSRIKARKLLALGADAATPFCRAAAGQGGVPCASCSAQPRITPRCAHIMADPREPACAGIVRRAR